MSVLPVELIVDIFSQLPVKSLLRFRCISKEFRFMIDDPDFIKRHQQRRWLDRTLIIQADVGHDLFTIDLELEGYAPLLELKVPFENWGIDLELIDSCDVFFKLIGSCDGLLAMSNCEIWFGPVSAVLWNVSTKKHRILPEFWGDIGEDDDIVDGFGYDVSSDEYKWVRVIKSPNKNSTDVAIYYVKANSWRRIKDISTPFHPYCSLAGIGVLVGGSLNWVVGHLITSFDLKDEKFYGLPLPNIAEYKTLSVMVLGVCLCLSVICYVSSTIDIWVMKEYRVKESWTKLFTFPDFKPPPSPPPTYPHRRGLGLGGRRKTFRSFYNIVALAYSRCGDALIFYGENGDAYRRDLEMEEAESVLINDLSDEQTLIVWNATTYVETLVSPFGFGH